MKTNQQESKNVENKWAVPDGHPAADANNDLPFNRWKVHTI